MHSLSHDFCISSISGLNALFQKRKLRKVRLGPVTIPHFAPFISKGAVIIPWGSCDQSATWPMINLADIGISPTCRYGGGIDQKYKNPQDKTFSCTDISKVKSFVGTFIYISWFLKTENSVVNREWWTFESKLSKSVSTATLIASSCKLQCWAVSSAVAETCRAVGMVIHCSEG